MCECVIVMIVVVVVNCKWWVGGVEILTFETDQKIILVQIMKF